MRGVGPCQVPIIDDECLWHNCWLNVSSLDDVIGRPRAAVNLSSTAGVTQIVAKPCDVAPDGTSALVTAAYLNVAHRQSHTDPSPIEPGRVYEFDV